MESLVKTVVIESPYRGRMRWHDHLTWPLLQVLNGFLFLIGCPDRIPPPWRWRNIRIVRQAMRDELLCGRAPWASHALYPLHGILDEDTAEERKLGIEAGLAISARLEDVLIVNQHESNTVASQAKLYALRGRDIRIDEYD
jgi:hypothetical protein